MDIRSLPEALRPLGRRVLLMLGRAVVSLVKDAGALQLIQAERLDGEVHDDMESFGHYGLASRSMPGAEAIIASLGGVRSHGVVIAIEDRRYRLTLEAEGEVALYDDLGQVVYLKRDRIQVSSPALVEIVAPSIDLRGDVLVTGKLEVAGDATFDAKASIGSDLSVTGNSTLGAGATQFVKLANDTPATKAKAK